MTASEASRQRFAELMLPHLDAAWRLARHLLGERAAAEDAVQEAMLRALAHFTSYRGGDARAWLLRIVRNAAYDAMAARGRLAPLDEAVAERVDPADQPEVALARKQTAEQVQRALAELPLPLRECLVLREMEGLSYLEIVTVTGVPIGTVMSRLWRARRAMLASCGGIAS